MTSHHLLVILSIVILPVFGRAFSISRGTAVRRCIGPYSRILKSPPHVTQQSTGEDAPPPSSGPSLFLGKPICAYHAITIPSARMSEGGIPRQDVSVEDLTPILRSLLSTSGMRNGVVHVISRHTTTAITINERESRLAQDVADYFLGICPPDERSSSERRAGGVRYLHNDIHRRPDGEEEAERCRANGWNVDDPAALGRWRDQEPINAHSHLISMMLGSSECIPVVEGEMVIGEWQSVLMVDLDGPRTRTVGVQLMGYE